MVGLTLLGEHCGAPEHQHLVKYNEIEIIFFSICDNTDFNATCMNPIQAFKFFES